MITDDNQLREERAGSLRWLPRHCHNGQRWRVSGVRLRSVQQPTGEGSPHDNRRRSDEVHATEVVDARITAVLIAGCPADPSDHRNRTLLTAPHLGQVTRLRTHGATRYRSARKRSRPPENGKYRPAATRRDPSNNRDRELSCPRCTAMRSRSPVGACGAPHIATTVREAHRHAHQRVSPFGNAPRPIVRGARSRRRIGHPASVPG